MEINLEQAKTSQCDTSVPAEQEKLISLALLAGSYMLKNGGETYRAEECTRRILMAGNADEIEIFAIPTSMIITVKIGGHYHTRSASVKKRDIDIDMIDRVNTVSRSIYEGTMSVNAAFEYLSPEKRKKTSPYMLGICRLHTSVRRYAARYDIRLFRRDCHKRISEIFPENNGLHLSFGAFRKHCDGFPFARGMPDCSRDFSVLGDNRRDHTDGSGSRHDKRRP